MRILLCGVLVGKLSKYGQGEKRMGKVPAKRKNQELFLYQGERVEFISSLEDRFFLIKQKWLGNFTFACRSNGQECTSYWVARMFPDYPRCCWKCHGGWESSNLKSICSCSPGSIHNQHKGTSWVIHPIQGQSFMLREMNHSPGFPLPAIPLPVEEYKGTTLEKPLNF